MGSTFALEPTLCSNTESTALPARRITPAPRICHVHSSLTPCATGTRLLLRLGIAQLLLDIGCDAVEGLLDVDIAFGRDLEEWDTQLIGQRLAALRAYGPLFIPVAFVTDEDLLDAFGSVLLDIGEPGADVCRWIRE